LRAPALGRIGCSTVQPNHRSADQHRNHRPHHSPTAPGTQTAQKWYAGLPTRTRSHPRPASVFLRATTRTQPLTQYAGTARWLIVQKDPRGLGPPVCSNQGSKRPWGWPYSDPRASRISGVNPGELAGPCRASCRARQQVRGPVVLAPKGRSGTLTRKRSLVQIQYGPPARTSNQGRPCWRSCVTGASWRRAQDCTTLSCASGARCAYRSVVR